MVTNKKIHFMGIGGAGVSAVASFARAAGYEISGCDLDQNSQFLNPLVKDNVKLYPEHNSSHLQDIDILVVSPAIESLDSNNEELLTAKAKNLPVMIGEEFLAKYLLTGKKVIAITGTHGKSTTTAMVGKILEEAGLDPNVLVGAIVLDWGKNFRIGQGEYFVIEADEYKEKFLLYHPFVSVVTAIEMDHPEYFADKEAVREAFQKFVSQTNRDGFAILGQEVDLSVVEANKKVAENREFELQLIGKLNQVNASVAATTAEVVGISEEQIRAALKKFNGISRRFEFKGEEKGIKVFDDYGHHPTAIKATMEAVKEKFPINRIWLVYQPHMFTRTKYLFNEFVETFKTLDVREVILVDIFAARQENNENISSLDIVKAANKDNIKYVGNFEETADYLANNITSGDVVFVMGAGDIYKLSGKLLEKLKK